MPTGNNFQHSSYARTDPGERVTYRQIESAAPPDSPAWQDAIAAYGSQLSRAGVRAVIFLHGTHRGTDLFGMQRLDEAGGLKRGYSRGIPGMEALLALMREDSNGIGAPPGEQTLPLQDDEQTKTLIDDQSKDTCNFTADYVNQFEKAVNTNLPRPIATIRHLWSAEHHHLGRVLAACRVVDRLRAVSKDLKLDRGERILVQAHGHAGQVMALVSNFLASGLSSNRKALLATVRAYLEQTGTDPRLLENLNAIEPHLSSGHALHGAVLDVVTLGTPVRYGWEPSGLGQLLHIVNHRMMRPDGKRWLAKMELPQITMEMPIAWGGDYVQQLAVAGCDAVPTTPEAKEANKASWEILEPWEGFERWLECARKCVRCPNDGQCLLVDYKDSSGSANAQEHVYGHAAYTRLSHLLFNTAEIVQAFYSPSSTQV